MSVLYYVNLEQLKDMLAFVVYLKLLLFLLLIGGIKALACFIPRN
jgi:hypothetical protein